MCVYLRVCFLFVHRCCIHVWVSAAESSPQFSGLRLNSDYSQFLIVSPMIQGFMSHPSIFISSLSAFPPYLPFCFYVYACLSSTVVTCSLLASLPSFLLFSLWFECGTSGENRAYWLYHYISYQTCTVLRALLVLTSASPESKIKKKTTQAVRVLVRSD